MSILTQGLRRLYQKAAGSCLTNSCLLCGADSRDLICTPCADELPPLPMPHCPHCGEATSYGERCGRCLARPPFFDSTVALYRYDFPIDRLIHAFKYGHQLALADWLGSRLANALAGREFDLAVPLPMHPSRLVERGFNQAAEIARVLARRNGIRLDLDNCRRTRHTPPQAELPLKERSANICGAFECLADISGKRILLIDDVMTSGSSLNECARVLKIHGAADVAVGVIARTTRC